MKKNTSLFLILLLLISIGSIAQTDGGVSIGKGDSPANCSAILELVSTNKGLLIPRLTTEQRNAMYPDASAEGLMVFDNTLNAFYFWDGAAWKTVSNGNIHMVWNTPVNPGMAGEMVFDVTNSHLYVYSGSNWVNVGGNTSVNIVKDQSLTGSGTTVSPLGVAQGGITSDKIASNAVTGDKIANNTINVGKIQGVNGDQVLVTNSIGTPEWISKSLLGGGTIGFKYNETLSTNVKGELTIAQQTAQDGYILQWEAGSEWGWVPRKIRPINIQGIVDEGDAGQVLSSNGYGGFKWRNMPETGTGIIGKDAITSDNILDRTILLSDLGQNGATEGDVLRWNGTTWITAPVSTGGSSYVLPTASRFSLGGVRVGFGLGIDMDGVLSLANGTIEPGYLSGLPAGVAGYGNSGQVLTSNGAGGFAWSDAVRGSGSIPALTGDVTTTAGSFATTIAPNTVTSDKIANGTILLSDLGQNGAREGDVLRWNGTTWITAPVSTGGSSYVLPTASRFSLGGIRVGSGLTTDNDGVLSLSDDAITSAKITNGTISPVDMAGIGGNGTNGQVLTSNGSGGFVWGNASQGNGSITLSNTSQNYLTLSGTTLSANPIDLSGTHVTGILGATHLPVLTGEVTTTAGSLTTTIAPNAVTSAKIADGTIQGGDLNQMGATKDQVLAWNGSIWVPSTISANGVYSLPTATSITLGGVRIANNSELTIDPSTGYLSFTKGTIQPGNLSGLPATSAGYGTRGQVLTSNGTGGFAWADAAQGSGSVALSPTSENYLTINAAGTTITANKINLGTQVSGTLGASSLGAMGATATGQFLQWNGTTWGASSTNLTIGTGGNAVTITAPTLGSGAYNLKLPSDDGSADFVLKTDGSGNLRWDVDAVGAAGGGISSIGLSLPLYNNFTTLTADGAFTGTLTNQAANTVFSGPTSGGSAVPSFRALVPADIPILNQNTTGTAANISGGSAGQLLYQSASNVTAKLPVGSEGNVLTFSGGTPTWVAPAGGNGGALNVTADEKTSDYTVSITDDIILCNPTSAAITLTLPTSGITIGKRYYISNKGSKNVVISPAPRETSVTYVSPASGRILIFIGSGTWSAPTGF